MKLSLLIISTMLLVSCGKKTVNKYFEDPKVKAEYDKLKDDLNYLSNLVNTQGASITSLETLMRDTQSRLSELELENRVTAMVDPCGDMPNQYDEVLFKMSSGVYVAYFEQGANRSMSVLAENVHYRTTDAQACSFKIVSGQVIRL